MLASIPIYCTLNNIRKRNFFRTVFWAIPSVFALFHGVAMYEALSNIVISLELKENGTQAVAHFLSG